MTARSLPSGSRGIIRSRPTLGRMAEERNVRHATKRRWRGPNPPGVKAGTRVSGISFPSKRRVERKKQPQTNQADVFRDRICPRLIPLPPGRSSEKEAPQANEGDNHARENATPLVFVHGYEAQPACRACLSVSINPATSLAGKTLVSIRVRLDVARIDEAVAAEEDVRHRD